MARGAIEGMTNALVAAALVDDLAKVFDSDRWALVMNSRTQIRAHVAAGVQHAANLTLSAQQAADRGDETVGRILARAQLEAVMVTMFIHLQGSDALQRLAADHNARAAAWANDIENHNAALLAARRKARRRNRAVRQANRDRRVHNKQHPDAPLDLLPEVPGPLGEPIELTPEDIRAARVDGLSAPLSLRTIAGEVTAGLHDLGDPTSMVAAYNYAYRSLSDNGAHTGLNVLGSYIRRTPGFVRIDGHQRSSIGAAGSAYVAIVMTSHLAITVLDDERERGMLTTAERVLGTAERWMSEDVAAGEDPSAGDF